MSQAAEVGCSVCTAKRLLLFKHPQVKQQQRRVARVNPEDSKSNRAIGVALNDTVCMVLRDQIGILHKWVFVHMKPMFALTVLRPPSV